MSKNIIRGKTGESLAVNHLSKIGYRIIEKNYRTRIGEIDIIALDKDILVFIEVKTRTGLNYGYAFEAVDHKKQSKIINIAQVFIKHKGIKDTQVRFDIIEVYLTNNPIINHFENAFCQ